MQSSTSLEEVFYNELRGKTVTEEQAHILEWAEKRLTPAIERLTYQQSTVRAIEELTTLSVIDFTEAESGEITSVTLDEHIHNRIAELQKEVDGE